MVHLIFTASLIHIYNSCTTKPTEARAAADDLHCCCQALGEIGHIYRNATRALEVIICIKREWQSLAATRIANGKRPKQVNNEEAYEKRKRTMSRASQDLPQFQMPTADQAIQALPMDVMGANNDIYEAWQFLDGDDFGIGAPFHFEGTTESEITHEMR